MNKEGGSTLTIRKSNHVTDGFKGYKATLFAGEMSYTEINIPLRGGDDLFLHGNKDAGCIGYFSAEARYCCSAVTDCLPVMTTAGIYLPKKGDRRMKKRMIILFMALVIPFGDKQSAMDGDRPHEPCSRHCKLGQ